MFPLFTPKTDPRSFGPKTQRLLEGGDREEGQRARVSGSRQKWEGGPGGCRWVSVNCFVFFTQMKSGPDFEKQWGQTVEIVAVKFAALLEC